MLGRKMAEIKYACYKRVLPILSYKMEDWQIIERRYRWFARSFDAGKASIRLRLIEPMAALERRGIDVGRYRKTSDVPYDALIFSKSFTRAAITASRDAEAAGRAVIVDICDNMFDQVERRKNAGKRARIVEQLTRASIVTVSTPQLGSQLGAIMPEIVGKLRVIPDTLENLDAAVPGWSDRMRLALLRRFLAAHPGALHCVWFGKSSGSASGFAHLDNAVRELERFAEHHPVTLTVIGDSRARYVRAAKSWSIPSHYLPWSLGSFARALAVHRVAVLPVERNEYTAGKSINRPATAIIAGLGVVADAIESYEELRNFIPLDDWQGGLTRYAVGWAGEQGRLDEAREHLERRYGADVVAGQWERIFQELAASEIGVPELT